MKTADVVIPEHRHRTMNPASVRSLMESIREVGLLNPITVQKDGVLIAGLHRHAACELLGWTEIPATIVDLDDLRAELAELDENLEHSPLTVLQRSEHLARRKEIYESLHPETKAGVAGGKASGAARGERTDPDSGSVPAFIDDTAQRTGRSRTVIAEEVKIARDLPRDVRDAVRGTKVADSKSDLGKLARMPEGKQRAVAAKVEAGARDVKQALKQVREEEQAAVPERPHEADRFQLIHADFADADVEPGTVDAIICDPPYPQEFLGVFGPLGEFAARVLKPGGHLVVMVGQSYLPEILAALTPHVRYQWTLAYLTPGGQAAQVWPRKVNTFWKPLLWFSNGPLDDEARWIGDVTKSATNDNDKRFHHWGQSESGMADVIERFTLPGDLVVDPFLGGGTTGVVAVAMNRNFIGIDVDSQAVKTSAARLAETQENA